MFCCFFFFQAEDGIRDDLVTGVQTCALPISHGTAHVTLTDSAGPTDAVRHVTRMRRATLILLLSLFVLLSSRPSIAASSIVAANHDAAISRDLSAGTWTIGSAGAALTLGLEASRDFTIVKFVGPSGKAAATTGTPDKPVRARSPPFTVAHRPHGFTSAH